MLGLGPESREFLSFSLYISQNYFPYCVSKFFTSTILIFGFIMFSYILFNCSFIWTVHVLTYCPVSIMTQSPKLSLWCLTEASLP